MAEEWRPVVGVPDYEVSNWGRVRSYKGSRPRILRPCINSAGYHNHTLHMDGRPIYTYAHKLVMEAFVGPRPAGLIIRHWDDDKSNNVLSNLLYGTYVDNARDAKRNRALRASGAAA